MIPRPKPHLSSFNMEQQDPLKDVWLPPAPPLPALPNQTQDSKLKKWFNKISPHFAPLRLHFAINAGSLSDVQRFISDGIDLSFAAPTNGQTPLTLSILSQRYDIAMALIDAGADVSVAESTSWRRQPIHLASAAGNADLVDAILKQSSNLVNAVDAMLFTPLHHSAIAGQRATVSSLIRAGARVGARDDRGRTALFRAIEHTNMEVVDELIKFGCSVSTVDVFGWTPIYHATVCGHMDVVAYLLRHGADVNGNGLLTPLHAACGTQNMEQTLGVMRYTGVDFYMRRCRAMTPLVHQAVTVALLSNNNLDFQRLVNLLLDFGADTGLRDCNGATAFQVSAHAGRTETMRLLIAAGTNLTAERWLTELRWPDAIVENTELCQWLKQLSQTRVERLANVCRIAIRQHIHPPISEGIGRLPIPPQLQRFLQI